MGSSVMVTVRLRCQACGTALRIPNEVASKHTVVRCAKCQGLINVASARMAETRDNDETLTEQDKSERHRPKKKKQASVNTKWILTVGVGAAAALVVGLVCFFIYRSLSLTPQEKWAQDTLASLNKIADLAEGLNNPEDIPPALEKFRAIVGELKVLVKSGSGLSTPEEQKRVEAKYAPKMQETGLRLHHAMVRISQNPPLLQALTTAFMKEGPDLFAGLDLPRLGSGNALLSPDGNNLPGLFPGSSNPGGASRNQQPSVDQSAQSAQWSRLLQEKTSLMKSFVTTLASIQGPEQALAQLPRLGQTVDAIAGVEKQIKDLEQRGSTPAPAVVGQHAADQQKVMLALFNEMSRLMFIPGVAQALQPLDRQMKELGLVGNNTASNRPSAGTNPFEEAGDKTAKDRPPQAKGANPFEEDKTPSKSKSMGSARTGDDGLDAVLEKLESREFFTKEEGLKDLQSIKVQNQHKKVVLEALDPLWADRHPFIIQSAFAVFQKWANTPEDRALIGPHAGVLLKDVTLRKDAINYFRENKIVTAAGALAGLLKDAFENKEAARALIEIGPDAEKAVLPFVTDLDAQVRHMAIEVIARIGSKDALPQLQKVQNDRQVGLAARQAIQIIRKRDGGK